MGVGISAIGLSLVRFFDIKKKHRCAGLLRPFATGSDWPVHEANASLLVVTVSRNAPELHDLTKAASGCHSAVAVRIEPL